MPWRCWYRQCQPIIPLSRYVPYLFLSDNSFLNIVMVLCLMNLVILECIGFCFVYLRTLLVFYATVHWQLRNGSWMKFLAYWFQPGPPTAVAAIWGANKWLEASLFLSQNTHIHRLSCQKVKWKPGKTDRKLQQERCWRYLFLQSSVNGRWVLIRSMVWVSQWRNLDF